MIMKYEKKIYRRNKCFELTERGNTNSIGLSKFKVFRDSLRDFTRYMVRPEHAPLVKNVQVFFAIMWMEERL